MQSIQLPWTTSTSQIGDYGSLAGYGSSGGVYGGSGGSVDANPFCLFDILSVKMEFVIPT